jgi:tetratricopeptide (TPR) repeat protein
MGKSINLNKLDFSKYNKAASAYKNGQIKLAFNELKAFKKKSKLSSLIELPEQQAYFEVLVTFQLAQIEKMEILFLETIKLIRALQTKAKCLAKEPVFQSMLAESYRELKNYSTSEKYFEKVFAKIDNYSLNKELLFNYFLVLCKQYKREEAKKVVEKLEPLGDTKFKLAVFFEWLDFTIDCEDKVYALELVNKIVENELVVSESIQWKLIQRTNEMLSEPDFCREMITKFNLCKPEREYLSILSSVFYKSKNYKKSIDVITKEAIEADKSFSYNLLGKAHSQLKNYDKAFEYFLKSAEVVDRESVKTGSKAKMKKARNKINSLNLDMLSDNLLSKSNAATTNPMVFIIGFPRSGTTLLDSILRTQENVAVLSERPILNNTIKYIGEEFNKNLPEGLAKLSSQEIRLSQEYYLDNAKKVIAQQ